MLMKLEDAIIDPECIKSVVGRVVFFKDGTSQGIGDKAADALRDWITLKSRRRGSLQAPLGKAKPHSPSNRHLSKR